jgi:hypothetical protein
MIGGALARPCISYPDLFHPGTIWERYPYLLPNLFSAATVFIGVIIGFLFLEETHTAKKEQRDVGCQLGDRLIQLISKVPICQGLSRSAEKESLLKNDGLLGYKTATSDTGLAEADEFLPVYESRESSPNLAPRMAPNPKNVSDTKYVELDKPMVIFTKPVIMNIMSYGILAL